MRWIWVDRIIEFESGRRAVTIKNVSLAEEHLHDHFPGFPVMPASLMIEGMAQTGGMLVGEARQFTEKVVLAKVQRAVFFRLVRPGEQVRYETQIEQITPAAATTTGRILSNGDLVGEVDMVFSHIDQNMSGLEFPAENFVFTDQFLSLLFSFRNQSDSRVKL